MADISKIKLGNTTYDIKDVISRNGFSTASLVSTTDPEVGNGEFQFSKIAFYTDSNKTTELGSIPLKLVTIPLLTSPIIISQGITTNSVQFGDDTGPFISIGRNIGDNNRYFSFGIEDLEQNITSVRIPIGVNGTVALTSLVQSVNTEVLGIKDALGMSEEDATNTIDTYNEVKDFLAGLATSPDLAATLTSMNTDISNRALKSEMSTSTSGSQTTITLKSGTSATVVSDSSYVHTDNNYTTTEKNKLSGIAAGAEVNVQANWTESNSSSDAFIKNKPTKLSDFTDDVGYLTSHQDISGKLNKYSSGSSDWDTAPTSGSTKPVTSGGIYTALNNLTTSVEGAVTNVSYTSGTRTISKTINGTTTGVVVLPTASYNPSTETLEITLAATPS